MIHIDVIDGVPGSPYTKDLASYVPAFQEYDNLVAAAWSLEAAQLRFAPSVQNADPTHWWLVWNNRSNDPHAGGFHNEQPNGLPIMRVFAGDAIREGFSPTVDSTHEQAEARVDPEPMTKPRLWVGPDGAEYLVEVGDPCEQDTDGFEITAGGVTILCSDFVLPSYYGGRGPYDHRGLLPAPCPTLLQGGYISFMQGGQWNQKFAYLPDGKQSYRSRRYGRSARVAASVTV
jgi:hypothetical protein